MRTPSSCWIWKASDAESQPDDILRQVHIHIRQTSNRIRRSSAEYAFAESVKQFIATDLFMCDYDGECWSVEAEVASVAQRTLEAIIGRAILDEEFRLALFADPEATLADYPLTEGELAALKAIDAETLDACAHSIGRRVAVGHVTAE
jgi:hypothetical protein